MNSVHSGLLAAGDGVGADRSESVVAFGLVRAAGCWRRVTGSGLIVRSLLLLSAWSGPRAAGGG
jgi:hypothetical protein